MANTPTLEDLISQLPPNLGQAIMSPEQQQAQVQALMAGTAPEALRKYGTTAQQIAEGNFGRGMGLSSYNAYQQALNTLMQQEGMNRIQLDAQNQVDAAQRAAVGNAASYATSEKNRASQEAAQRRGIAGAKSGQLRGALIGGLGNLGAGVGGTVARDLTRPEGTSSSIGRAYNRLGGLFGGGDKQGQGTPGQNMGGTFAEEGQAPTDTSTADAYQPSYPQGLNLSGLDSGGGGYGGGYDFSGGAGIGFPDIQMPDFSLESLYGGFNNLPGNFWDQGY